MQDDAPGPEYVLLGQAVHGDVPPKDVVPAGQAEHTLSVIVVHSDVCSKPGEHTLVQLVQDDAPDMEYVLAGHCTQVVGEVAPTEEEYVPAMHAVQLLDADVVEYPPAGQLVQELDTAVEYLPAAQVLHTVALVAPTTVENVPATHDVQMLDAEVVEYVPAGQLIQELDPAVEYLPVLHA